MNTRNALAAGFVTVALAGGLLVAAPAALAASCETGRTKEVTITNPVTGREETGTVTECPTGAKVGSVIGFVTPAVGVDFRDDNGNRTASGMSPYDQFQYLGQTKAGKNGDGTLIKVRQLTKGKGGWGSLYEGWIPVKYVPAGLIDLDPAA